MGLNKHGYTPKKRNSNSRKRKKIIFIATEGKNKTEKLYFKKYNSDKVQIRFAKGGSTDPQLIWCQNCFQNVKIWALIQKQAIWHTAFLIRIFSQ